MCILSNSKAFNIIPKKFSSKEDVIHLKVHPELEKFIRTGTISLELEKGHQNWKKFTRNSATAELFNIIPKELAPKEDIYVKFHPELEKVHQTWKKFIPYWKKCPFLLLTGILTGDHCNLSSDKCSKMS